MNTPHAAISLIRYKIYGPKSNKKKLTKTLLCQPLNPKNEPFIKCSI
jgi:hypothetical protein